MSSTNESAEISVVSGDADSLFDDIQRKVDGSYIVTLNGYPFHVTQNETPAVYDQVERAIASGAPVVEYVEPGTEHPDALALAAIEYNRLRALADYNIAPLQDALDIGEATDAEREALIAWKTYRVALSRVAQQPEYPDVISWPPAPR